MHPERVARNAIASMPIVQLCEGAAQLLPVAGMGAVPAVFLRALGTRRCYSSIQAKSICSGGSKGPASEKISWRRYRRISRTSSSSKG